MAIMFLFVMGIIARPEDVSAKNPTQASIRPGVQTSSYDITGDQKNDTILVTSEGAQAKVYINGNLCLNKYVQYFEGDIVANIYTLKNGKPFFYLFYKGVNGYGGLCGLFQYQNGKLVQIEDFITLFPWAYEGYIVKIKGNFMRAEVYTMSETMGGSKYRFSYVYKNGTLKRKSAVGAVQEVHGRGELVQNHLIVNKDLTLYKSPRSNQIAFTLKKGDVVSTSKVYTGKYGQWSQIKYNGKKGWIKWADKITYPLNPPFENIMYVG